MQTGKFNSQIKLNTDSHNWTRVSESTEQRIKAWEMLHVTACNFLSATLFPSITIRVSLHASVLSRERQRCRCSSTERNLNGCLGCTAAVQYVYLHPFRESTSKNNERHANISLSRLTRNTTLCLNIIISTKRNIYLLRILQTSIETIPIHMLFTINFSIRTIEIKQ